MKHLLAIIAIAAIAGCAAKAPTAPVQRHPTRRGLVGPEVVLASNYDDPNAVNSNTYSTTWLACSFKPVDPPADATGINVTQATVYVGKTTEQPSAVISWEVQVRTVDASGKPTGTIVDKALIAAASIPLIADANTTPPPTTVTFTHAAVSLGGCAVVVARPPFSPNGYTATQTGGTQSPADLALYGSTTQGGVWSVVTGKDLLVEVKGTYTTP